MSKYVIISNVPNIAKLSIAFMIIIFFQERDEFFFRCLLSLSLKSGYHGDGRLMSFPVEAIYDL